MLRDFIEFLRAVWKEWVVLLTGGGLMAALALWQLGTGKSVPASVNWLIVGFTLIVAAFLAWRKEWIASTTGSPVHVDPAQIVRPYWDRTKIQADIYAKQYLGRHVRLRAILSDVSTEGPLATFVHLKAGEVSITSMVPRWRARPFLPLAAGAVVTVAGRIEKIDALSISLSNCQFLKVEDVPDSSETHPGDSQT
jgi:hypothetical protein